MRLEAAVPPAYERGIAATGLRRCCVETVRTTDERVAVGESMRCASCDTWLTVGSAGLWQRGRQQ